MVKQNFRIPRVFQDEVKKIKKDLKNNKSLGKEILTKI